MLVSFPAHTKDTPLLAIELFDGPNGASYAHISNLLLNGKAEVRSCGGASLISRSSYGKLEKIPLNSATTALERDAKGVMLLTRSSGSECVVPSNLKFDKDEPLSPAQLADKAIVQGQVVNSSPAGITALPPFKPGVKFVFVASPDTELAEYLRADRTHATAALQDYLSRYPKAAHTDAAKQTLAALLTKEGQAGFSAYRQSAATNSPSYSDLKTARLRADQILALLPNHEPASKLRDDVRQELTSIARTGNSELQAYKQALAAHATGYIHLGNARRLDDHGIEIDPQFEPLLSLQGSIAAETRNLESALHNAESSLMAQRYDEAVAAIADYRAFSGEEPRIASIIDSAFKFHSERGKSDAGSQNWKDAVQEYKRAAELKPGAEIDSALRQAQSELETATNRAAADAALRQSADLQEEKRFIDAYEVLAELPDAQRALVQEQMHALETDYVKSASDEAKKLRDAHVPIAGRADEIGVQKAYEYLRHASTLESEDQNLKLRLDLISQTLSDYYVVQAKKYLEKPLGSGVGIAWLYLNEAQLYQSNRDDIRDERTKNSAVHNVRSTLSIKVGFRDQTSRRESSGFADQLSDAIATGLETTLLPVKVIRASDTTPVDPNFQLIGDVIDHHSSKAVSVDSLESEYRAAEREVPNEEWNKANRDYEGATLDLQNAQKVLEGAQAHGKKKEIASATTAVQDAQKKVEEAHRKLDSIPRTTLNDVIKPYSYTKRTIDLTAVVELGFRIIDSAGNTIASTASIKREIHKPFVILENVKSEDTRNVKQSGAAPDEAQFLNDVEVSARDALIEDVRNKVETLPREILAQAHKHLSDGDTDGTAESYILYLNSTPDKQTAERDEAKKFLREHFNMVWPTGSAS